MTFPINDKATPYFVFDRTKTEYECYPHHKEHGEYQGAYGSEAEAIRHSRRSPNYHVVLKPEWTKEQLGDTE